MKRFLAITVMFGLAAAALASVPQGRSGSPPRGGFASGGKVTAVAGSRVSATNAADKKITFSVNPSEAQMFSGQTLWINTADKKVKFVKFPMKMHRKDNLGNSHHMKTSVIVSNTGRIDGTTRTWSNEALRGFTGGVKVFLFDSEGNVLYNTPLHKYGVNGEAVPGAASDRTETWTEPVSKAILAKTRSVGIVHAEKGTSHWNDFVSKSKDVLELAETAVKIYTDAKGSGGGMR